VNFQNSVARFLLAGILTIVLAGCATSTETGKKDIFDQSRIEQIKKGSSTKDNITVLFGPPEGTEFAANGDEMWSYHYVLRTSNPLLQPSSKTYLSYLDVTFDNRGIVKAYTVQNSNQ
jgi:outer membrane protein assembly factor BamE (lipoprotein component of BamABCDE complex)